MKRKLVLIFEDNKLLHATLTERGRRVKLPKITTNEDALAQVKDTLTNALAIVGTAPSTASTTNTTFAGLLHPLADGVSGHAVAAGQGCTFDPATGLLHPPSASKQTQIETTSMASVEEQPRPRSVCARPKKDEKESPTIAPCS